MKMYDDAKEILGQEMADGLFAIKDDAIKLKMVSTLCTCFEFNKLNSDFAELEELLIERENVLISINGSKYLNRFSDFNAEIDPVNGAINLTADITNGSIGQSIEFNICEVVKKGTVFHCEDEDGETLLIEFVTVSSIS